MRLRAWSLYYSGQFSILGLVEQRPRGFEFSSDFLSNLWFHGGGSHFAHHRHHFYASWADEVGMDSFGSLWLCGVVFCFCCHAVAWRSEE